jgi:hypothetical protein
MFSDLRGAAAASVPNTFTFFVAVLFSMLLSFSLCLVIFNEEYLLLVLSFKDKEKWA